MLKTYTLIGNVCGAFFISHDQRFALCKSAVIPLIEGYDFDHDAGTLVLDISDEGHNGPGWVQTLVMLTNLNKVSFIAHLPGGRSMWEFLTLLTSRRLIADFNLDQTTRPVSFRLTLQQLPCERLI